MHVATLRLLAGALAVLGVTGCQFFDARPAGDAGFNRTTAPVQTRAAFLQQVWVAESYRGKSVKSRFSSVYVAPVDTRFLRRQNWWQQQSMRKPDLARDVEGIAQRMRLQFQDAIANYPVDAGASGEASRSGVKRRMAPGTGVVLEPFFGAGPGNSRLQLARAPGPGVLVLELALVELVPSKAFWNAGATVAGFVLPGAGLLSAAGRGSIAIEGRARDGATNLVFATFKDRRADKVAPVNLGSYTWYHGAEGNIADWAAEFAELLNTPPGQVINRPSPVTLRPW